MATTRLVDLTQPIDESIPMFPGLPGLELSTVLSREASRAHYAEGVEFLIQRYAITGNSGTYMDTPYHRYPHGLDLATLPLESTVGLPGVRIDARDAMTSGRRRIDESFLNGTDVRGKAVLCWTGWDDRWPGDDYLEPNPFLCRELATNLIAGGAVLVGIDTWNIDDTEDMSRPAHSVLLSHGIPIVENLCGLGNLSMEGFQFSAAPLPVRRGTAIPVRAYAVIDE
jgi:arylformamidase